MSLMIIQSGEQLTQLIQQSDARPLFLYKHSSRCGSSRVAHIALNQFISRFPDVSSRFAFGVIRVVEEKALSDRVSLELGIPHVSPQIILINRQKVVWHASHQQINSNQLCRIALHFLNAPETRGKIYIE
ncbi:bacillithiol system redox-active protein YtxJ [Paenibacillus apiarius]|uniref:bacillithiol system redox-active protein YtxJ n=1 Tax=Paenibacillus apiarius TaxID=46240 RepID=UPI00197F3D19|nr:bacillithiol system redox-active protein YtxJ [Paenibacillus apiarius]MBN3523171.1 bacillithiol system redox-active protein YtxJ [Paenibacillus apiarius]